MKRNPWKWMVGILILLGRPIFRDHVSFRECTSSNGFDFPLLVFGGVSSSFRLPQKDALFQKVPANSSVFPYESETSPCFWGVYCGTPNCKIEFLIINRWYTLPKMNECPPKRDHLKGNESSSNHHFSGDISVFREVLLKSLQLDRRMKKQ